MNAGRTQYIVCYDIRDPKRLRLTHKLMLGYGNPLQYSVFLCELSRPERLVMEQRLREVTNQRDDSIAIIDMGPLSRRSRNRIYFLGKGKLKKPPRAVIL